MTKMQMNSNFHSDFIVVGTGPTAAISVDILVNRGVFVTVIDRGETRHSSVDDSKFKSAGLLKSHFGSYYPYNVSDDFFLRDKSVPTWFSSKSQGGFTKVWGATLSADTRIPNFLADYHTNGDSLLSRAAHSSIFKFANPQHLAVSLSKCIGCGKCLIGCPHGAIWDSSILMASLLHSEKIEVLKDSVQSINFQSGLIEVKCREKVISTKNLILCGGPLGNLEILARSGLIENSVTFSETRMFFGLLVHRKKIAPTEKEFSLSTSTVDLPIRKEKLSLQFYEDLRGLRFRYLPERIANQSIVKFCFAVLNRFITPFVGYMPTSISPNIHVDLNKRGGILRSSNIHLMVKIELFRTLFQYFLKSRILLLGISVSQAGAGYHVGAIKRDSEFDIVRKALSTSGILVLDSGILESLETGPMTHKIMALAEKELNNFLSIRRIEL